MENICAQLRKERSNIDYTYYYHGLFYRWEVTHADYVYRKRKIRIENAVQSINDVSPAVEEQDGRWKYIGRSSVGILSITTDDETRIITAWHASAEEIKLWLGCQGRMFT